MSIYKIHTTRAGDRVPLCMMGDSHILNTIKLFCKRMKEAQAVLANPVQAPSQPILQVLAGKDFEKISRQQKSEAEQAIRKADELLGSYLLAASLRPQIIEEAVSCIQDAYGILGQVRNTGYELPAANAEVADEDEDDDDDIDYSSREFVGYYDADDY